MKIHNLTIGKQLAIGLGCILVFVIVLGIVTGIQEERLWQETKGIYDHPLKVRQALANIQVNTLLMHRSMRDLVMSKNESEWQGLIQDIDASEADVLQDFTILYDRYLGPRSDIDTAYADFIRWRSMREKTIQLIKEGRSDEAEKEMKPSGSCGSHVTRIITDLSIISDYARNKSDQFYQSAETLKNELLIRLILLTGIILLLSALISYLLLKGIRSPVKELTKASEEYRTGNSGARCRYDSDNELGILSRSFNSLVETIETEMESRKNAAVISEIMLREEELIPFCQELLKNLLLQTHSQIGAIYLLNQEKSDFNLIHSIGLPRPHHTSFSAINHEGEFGIAIATKQIQRIKEIPEDTIYRLSTAGCEIRPREIVTIPILNGADIVAMISLSSVSDFSNQAFRLIEDTSGMLAARFNGVLAYARNRELSKFLEEKNRELSVQSRELLSQTRELKGQNIELAMQKQQLDEANRLKSVFLSNMSHELRTPLNSVIALSGVLSRRLFGTIPDDEYSYLEVIERNGRLLLSLINDILDIARVESGREELHVSNFFISRLVHSVCDTLEIQAKEKGIILYCQTDGENLEIASDYQKCQHIVQNLVANAIKFTESGSVTISTTVADPDILISVTDTGIGIAEEMLPYIFEEFRQGDERIGRTYGGSGLGLSIARKYARVLNGDITVSSTPGSGSIFTLRLPHSIETGEPVNLAFASITNQISSDDLSDRDLQKNTTILLVEDNEPAIIQIRDLLEANGYQISVARNGKEALELLQDSLPDAVILDLMMPEVDGFTVLKLIRSQERSLHLPVLILTAKHITQEELEFLKGNHVHQLIQKGDISRNELISAVRRMVSEKEEESIEPAGKTRLTFIGNSHPRILIIEDNPDNLTSVRAMLKEKAELIEAIDGRTGINKASQHKPDIILLDISLPELDGFQVLKFLKSDESLRTIPVVALTARAMKGDRDEILSLGFDGYLSKPLNEALLLDTIYRLLYA